MRRVLSCGLAFSLALLSSGAAQSAPTPATRATPEPTRPASPEGLRREAAEIATVRALLADADPTVRLLAVRDYARSPNPILSQLAIETGLSSTELAMQEAALRAVLATTRQIVITVEPGGCLPPRAAISSFDLPVTAFDAATGTFTERNWSGQLGGATFTFVAINRSGTLVFDPEAREFRGTVNLNRGIAGCTQNASWRPR